MNSWATNIPNLNRLRTINNKLNKKKIHNKLKMECNSDFFCIPAFSRLHFNLDTRLILFYSTTLECSQLIDSKEKKLIFLFSNAFDFFFTVTFSVLTSPFYSHLNRIQLCSFEFWTARLYQKRKISFQNRKKKTNNTQKSQQYVNAFCRLFFSFPENTLLKTINK